MRKGAYQAQTTVVIIDDEASMREACCQVLAQAGYRTAAAPNAGKGLELAARLRPEVTLIDLKMPGMSGMDALREMRRTSGGTMVVVMTAYAELESAIEAMRAGACDYLRKPFDDETLLRTIRAASARAGARARPVGPGQGPATSTDPLAAEVRERLPAPVAAAARCVSQLSDAGADPLTARQNALLEEASRSLAWIARLLEDWQIVAELENPKAGPPERKAVHLRRLLESAWAVVARELDTRNVAFDCRAPEHSRPVWGNERLLQRLFVNIMLNAVQYMPNEGRVRVEQTPEGTNALIALSHTGMPIPADRLPLVFEPSSRPVRAGRRQGATSGIELAAARAIAAAHDGSLEAESLIGGTRFTVCLPLAPDTQGDPPC
ncbi:MAG: response regulator [Kiritimatiellae bacterium]|nr:response regulator [Kiritimatiellia bacterium]